MITAMIDDVVRELKTSLRRWHEQSLAGVRAARRPVIALSTERAAR